MVYDECRTQHATVRITKQKQTDNMRIYTFIFIYIYILCDVIMCNANALLFFVSYSSASACLLLEHDVV